MKWPTSNNSHAPIIFKTAGGVALQTMALLNAIEISLRLERPFKIRHYPNGTGGYYPFGIVDLLYPSEIDSLNTPIKGLDSEQEIAPGGIVNNHPIFSDSPLNYAKLLEFLRRLGILPLLQRLRREWVLKGTYVDLQKIPKSIRYVSGSFAPVQSQEALRLLKQRFQNSELSHVFSSSKIDPNLLVIHIRLGNKRTAFSHPSLGGAVNSVIDPSSIRELLEINKLEHLNVIAISDEPLMAVELLSSVGIVATQSLDSKSMWSDLALVSSAAYFIGTWSTVSMLAVACFADGLREVYFPANSADGKSTPWENPHVNFYPTNYLGKESEIYKKAFNPNSATHGLDYQSDK
jgi:hypothetical protein